MESRRAMPTHVVWTTMMIVMGLAGGCVQPPPTPTGDVALETVAEGFVSPVGLVAPPDGSGRLFILDQVGVIRIVDADGQLLDEPFLDVRDRLVELMPDFDERGLLGLAFHPDYADNGRFFVFYTAPPGEETPPDFNAQSTISEFRVSDADPNVADPSSERILLRIDKPEFNHNGGQLAFGPDGMLYISAGDGGGANDVDIGHTEGLGNAQDRTKLLGKLLRIDVDQGDPYAIPDDNPFVSEDATRPEIWALGLRNPWRFSFDSGGEHELFVGDAGQDVYEEVDVIERGGNYGWNIREGLHCFDPNDPGNAPETCAEVDASGQPLIAPIIEYAHADAGGNPIGVVVIGGYVYRGSALADLAGDYVYGDYSKGFDRGDGTLFAARRGTDGTWTSRELAISGTTDARIGRFILGFGQDADGELYVLTTDVVGPKDQTGRVFRLVKP